MEQRQAEAFAAIIGGEAWQSGGGIWLVTRQRGDGHVVVFDGQTMCEYESEDAFDEGRQPLASVAISRGPGGEPEWDAQDRWVIQDGKGRVLYQHDALEVGWSSKFEAERQAAYLRSREGGVWAVREQ